MQVATQDTHVTHAVIGGGPAMHFGIVADAAFFQVLSSSLYKYPMYAMIREVMCNAYDAHLLVGKGDLPIKVTLTDEHGFRVRDYGPGIPPEKMGEIYAMFGKSTKKNDGRQTGGFGLGCKSPFAYTDNFEVKTFHGGMCTIYRVSKSEAAVDGLPSMKQVTAYPSQETGVEVTIPLNPEKNNSKFRTFIEEIAHIGDIPMVGMLDDGAVSPMIGLSTAENELILLTNVSAGGAYQDKRDHGRIRIRYGNVVYPIADNEAYSKLYALADKYLEGIGCHLLMQAPPDSMTPQPSREAFTNSALTLNTTSDLLSKFLDVAYHTATVTLQAKATIQEKIKAEADRVIKAKSENSFMGITRMMRHGIISTPGVQSVEQEGVIRSLVQLSNLMAYQMYAEDSKITPVMYLQNMSTYLMQLVANKDTSGIDPGLVRSWLTHGFKMRHNLTVSHYWRRNHKEAKMASKWFHRHVIRRLLKKIDKAGANLDMKALRIVNDHDDAHSIQGKKYPKPLTHAGIWQHRDNLAFFGKPAIVLHHNDGNIIRRVSESHTEWMAIPDANQSYLDGANYFTYCIPRREEAVAEARAELAKLEGVFILDLTGRTKVEEEQHQARLRDAAATRERRVRQGKPADAPKKKSGVGLFRADQINVSDILVDTELFRTTLEPERIKEPEFIGLISTSASMKNVVDALLNSESAGLFLRIYGKRGALVNNSATYETYKAKGAMTVPDFLMKHFLHEIQTSPSLHRFYSRDIDKMVDYVQEHATSINRENIVGLLKTMYNIDVFHEFFPEMEKLSEDDMLKIALWKSVTKDYYAIRSSRGSNERLQAVNKAIQQIPLSMPIQRFLDELIASEEVGVIDFTNDAKVRRLVRSNPEFAQHMIGFIKAIINKE